MTATATKTLYERLRRVGFTKPYLRKVAALPEWWDDALWADPASRAVGLTHLARHLGIDIASLQEPSAALRLKDFGVCKYKKRAGTADDELLLARVIATRAAQLAAAATDRPAWAIPPAADLRDAVLETDPWVGFGGLLDFCWAAGVPVLHVNNFPADARKKPMGFTLRVGGRPAIVLCLDKPPAWQLFILAHELGHLHHGHVPADGALLDETVHDNEPDAEESQADRYAAELLAGRPGGVAPAGGRWPNAATLAEQARDIGRRNQVDPGHVVLRLAHGVGGGFWGVAAAALKILEPGADAVAEVNSRLAANLDWGRLPEDSSVFLSRVTGLEPPG